MFAILDRSRCSCASSNVTVQSRKRLRCDAFHPRWLCSRKALVSQLLHDQRPASAQYLLDDHRPPDARIRLTRERERVVDMVARLCEVFHLQTVTAGLAVHYFDLYMDSKPVAPQIGHGLLAIVGVLLSSKMWERKTPSLDQFSQVSDQEVSPEEIRACELDVLHCLGWKLLIVSPHSFLDILVSSVEIGQKQGFTPSRARLLIDMSYYETRALAFPESVIAAAAILGSFPALSRDAAVATHVDTLSQLCCTSPATISMCMQVLLDRHAREVTVSAPAVASVPEADDHLPTVLKSTKDRAESPDSVLVASLGLSSSERFSSSRTTPASFDGTMRSEAQLVSPSLRSRPSAFNT